MSDRAPQRVVVTGIGIVSSIGENTDDFWAGCLLGASVVAPIPASWRERFEPGSQVWSPLALPDFQARGLSRTESMQQDPVALIAACAAEEALGRAGLALAPVNARQNTRRILGVAPERAGVFLGTGIGGASTMLAMHANHLLGGAGGAPAPWRDTVAFPPRFNPFTVAMTMPNAPAAYLGIKLGLTGRNDTATVACASGTVAIGRAYRAVASGDLELALAGGSEYVGDAHGGVFRGFDAARTLARGELPPERVNRPFDARRSGFLFSQGGAALLVLEARDRALSRGAPVLGELVGFAESFDAHSMMSIEPSGRAIRDMLDRLLAHAGLTPRDVDYVNAHGTGTELNDTTEAEIIGAVIGEHALVNSTKSLLGHTIGASGALEAAVAVLSVATGRTHPCRNLEEPIAPLRFVVGGPSAGGIRHAISQSFAFGGHNAALAVRRHDETGGER